jgi:hypothetical protein
VSRQHKQALDDMLAKHQETEKMAHYVASKDKKASDEDCMKAGNYKEEIIKKLK